MKRCSLFLVYFCAAVLELHSQTDDMKNSPIGKLIYDPKSADIETTSWSLYAWKTILNSPEERDILLLDWAPIFSDVTLNVRLSKLKDGRIVIISISDRRPESFYVMIRYKKGDKSFNESKLVECRVSPEGTIVELSTQHGIDPNGKDGFVEYVNGKSPNGTSKKYAIKTEDPLVKRYQNEVNNAFLLLKNE
ncbi:hypothetical protein A3A09_02390 [Candidatus Nomurabacteria bacterium RIFCSPLOWO2_01_FULL_42_20]|uniref:Uncharacterized protein n=1 Tax=Candidatus Nomurabacteria bacterium RIFCSPHIGHO2_01_FULL_42_16 TaxID=1801743 RepID=A0A1F6VK75_9BACT|nr:MAG: hypothetical protein A2824_01405 [Candidatus Nomurabacteria bacterium RIFCSPHIGHO2_01_FULL_42_16]OGI92128.1 MAG: hypothetical protein A3A09_02390 [Candidatus Nomurabacteria bacterium RIFCSPLOWO2_01_FULL_42_20]